MLLIDQMASKSSGGSHQPVAVSDIESASSPKSSPRRKSVSSSHPHGVTWTTTLGLLVHAAADGIAMGKFLSLCLELPYLNFKHGAKIIFSLKSLEPESIF